MVYGILPEILVEACFSSSASMSILQRATMCFPTHSEYTMAPSTPTMPSWFWVPVSHLPGSLLAPGCTLYAKDYSRSSGCLCLCKIKKMLQTPSLFTPSLIVTGLALAYRRSSKRDAGEDGKMNNPLSEERLITNAVTYAEAAEDMSIPLGTVKSRLARARSMTIDKLQASTLSLPWQANGAADLKLLPDQCAG